MSADQEECFISVDIEAAGPVPALYSMLSIGACAVESENVSFECILKPTTRNFVPEAMEVTGFNIDQLEREGQEPPSAMKKFAEWVKITAADKSPVFVGLNAAFDWSFVNYYFHSCSVENPFGFAPVDIKALYMGRFHSSWKDATSRKMAAALFAESKGNHNALVDAKAQAELFRLIRANRS